MQTNRLLTAFFFLSALLLLIGLLPVHGEAEIYDTVVRLHVIANSDTEEDQALKLQVRDAVLEVTSPLLADCDSQQRAEQILNENRDAILQAAREVIAANGREDSVELFLDWEDYPTRNYDSFCFPAGSYLSLRVCLGDAQGQNWWCCLFPPICLSSSVVSDEDAEDAFISVGLTPAQYKIITENEKPVYKVRFKILEVIKSVFS